MDVKRHAIRNRNYYLAEKRADDGKQSWHRYVKSLDNYSEPILVSPKMAKEVLEGFDFRQPTRFETLGAVVNNELNQAYRTVTISFSGRLLDGREVLEVVVASNNPAIVFFSFNVSDKLTLMF